MQIPQIDFTLTGKHISSIIQSKGYNFSDIALALSISESKIFELLAGKHLLPTEPFFALSKLLQVPLSELLIEKERP